jgi:hypothetical protein
MLQAIETRNKGYRFRSRLEARWAVFFDKMGTRWGYEKEGFHLSNGEMYLPDFWLPDLGVWIEVKGQKPTDAELQRCRMLRDGTDSAVAIFHGLPSEDCGNGTLYCFDSCDSGGGCSVWYGVSLGQRRGLAFWFPGCESNGRTFFADCLFQRLLPIATCRGPGQSAAEAPKQHGLNTGRRPHEHSKAASQIRPIEPR